MNQRKQIRLVNKAFDINAQIKALTEQLNAIKGQFEKEGEGVYAGSNGVAIAVTSRIQTKFNSKIAKSLMTPADLEKCFYNIESTVVSFVID